MERRVPGNLWPWIRGRNFLRGRSLGSRGISQMKTALGIGLFGALVVGVGSIVAVGWVYEGPRRFIHRLRLRKALR